MAVMKQDHAVVTLTLSSQTTNWNTCSHHFDKECGMRRQRNADGQERHQGKKQRRRIASDDGRIAHASPTGTQRLLVLRLQPIVRV